MLESLGSNLQQDFIPWAAPVPSFGDPHKSAVGTLGINPSDREFVNSNGEELTRSQRRFQTLNSLQIDDWNEVDELGLRSIQESCSEYFFRNPYRAWFDKILPIVGATGHSYYDRINPACHLDLVPFATSTKWGELTSDKKRKILSENAEFLSKLVADSGIQVLILNGISVVREFESVTGCSLERTKMNHWHLPRKNGKNVPGYSYTGRLNRISGNTLGREIQVLGYNHNIQSSFGVTKQVVRNIAAWISEQTVINEQKNAAA